MAYDLSWAQEELQQIIYELVRISGGIRNDFSGISNDVCSDELDLVYREYCRLLVELKKAKKK